MPSLIVIGSQIKEKQGGTMCQPSLYGSKDPSLNRVKAAILLCVKDQLCQLSLGMIIAPILMSALSVADSRHLSFCSSRLL